MSEWRSATVEECLVPVDLPSTKVQTRDYKASGAYPIVDQGQQLVAGRTDEREGLISELPVVVFGDHTRALKYIDFPFVRGADGTQVLRPRTGILPSFFYYALRALEIPSRGYNRHFKILKEKEIRFPDDLDEQSNVANLLRLIEDASRLQEQQRQAWARCKRAVSRDVFTRGLRSEEQQETVIGSVPSSWALVEFSSVREWLQYGTSTHCTTEINDQPVLRIPNIESGRVNPTDLKYAKVEAADATKYRLEDGDLLFIRTNGVVGRLGNCAVFAGNPKGALFASYLIRARLKLNRIDPYYAAYFFGSENGTQLIGGRATPAADGKFNLNTGTIDNLPLPLPPTLEEQREIVSVLRALDQKIDLHERKRVVLEGLFKSLLHKLMTGEIRISDLDLSALGQSTTRFAA